MILRTRLRLGAVVLVCAAAGRSFAADLPSVLTDYNVTAWSDKDGLPRGTIWALAQDQQGYLWIGSEFGLLRFDGLRFLTWEALGNAPLPDEPVRALRAAADGSLWVGLGGRSGIVRIKGREVRVYAAADGLPPGETISLAEDTGGVIWAGHNEGLYRFDGERWQKDQAIPTGRVRKVFAGGSGRLFAVLDQSVVVRRPGAKHFDPIQTPERFVSSVHEDRGGNVWMSDTFVGVMTDHAEGVRRLPVRALGSGAALTGVGATLLSDHAGGLWIGTSGEGLWHARGATTTADLSIETVTTLTGLSNDIVNSLLEDRDGNIWAGTADGLNRLRRHPFTSLTDLGVVNGIDVGADGTMWAAVSYGLVRFAPDGPQRRELVSASELPARAMHADRDGGLWVATDEGVTRYAGPFGSAKRVSVIDTMRRVRGIASDSSGGVWLYDLDRGMGRWDGHRLEIVPLPPEYQHALICAIHADSHGRAWIGLRQERALAITPDRRVESYGPEQGLDPGTCNMVSEDRDGNVWVLGVHGMSRFSDGTFTTMRRPGEVPLESLQGMVQDDAGGVWLNALSGITRMELADIPHALEGNWDRVRARTYNASNGVAGKAARVGRSAVRAADGRLWFLTSRGITIIDPSTPYDAPPSVPVRIDNVVVDDQRYIGLPSDLRPRVRRVEMEFSLASLSPGPRPRFRYRLDGFDTDWRDPNPTQRRVTYTNLPPRSYRFQVEYLAAEGTAGSTDTWAFTVRPAFYQTAWFAGLGLVAAGGLATLAWRRRIRQVRGEFALLLKERVRLSREIHDTLLQSLIGVSLQLEQVQHDVDASPSVKDRLVKARRQVEEYIQEARESIWNLRSSALEREGLAAALRHAGERAVDAPASFHFTVTGPQDRCSPDVEEQLLRIGQEALANAAHHADARQIGLELRYDETSVILRVHDDGRGFDPSHITGANGSHWGLTNMKERAETVGGTLRVTSAPGEGTQIEAAVPRIPPPGAH